MQGKCIFNATQIEESTTSMLHMPVVGSGTPSVRSPAAGRHNPRQDSSSMFQARSMRYAWFYLGREQTNTHYRG